MIDNSGKSALYFACKHERTEIVDLLIEKGATVIVDQDELVNDLCQSASNGNLNLLKLFHKSEVDLNIKNYDDKTLQYIA